MSNAAFQLNEDLSEQVKQIVNDWIRIHYDEIWHKYLETYDDEDDNKDDALRELILYEYFNKEGRDFGRYAKKQLEVEWSIPIIQYCNGYYEDNFGAEQLLQWKRFEDMSYLCRHLGYVWGMENGDEIIELFKSLGDEIPFK